MEILRGWEMIATFNSALNKASEQARKVTWVNILG